MTGTELKALLSILRESGVSHYSGPTLGGDSAEVVQLELGPLPAAPEVKRQAEPIEAPKRYEDGLTEEEQRIAYLSSGG